MRSLPPWADGSLTLCRLARRGLLLARLARNASRPLTGRAAPLRFTAWPLGGRSATEGGPARWRFRAVPSCPFGAPTCSLRSRSAPRGHLARAAALTLAAWAKSGRASHAEIIRGLRLGVCPGAGPGLLAPLAVLPRRGETQ